MHHLLIACGRRLAPLPRKRRLPACKSVTSSSLGFLPFFILISNMICVLSLLIPCDVCDAALWLLCSIGAPAALRCSSTACLRRLLKTLHLAHLLTITSQRDLRLFSELGHSLAAGRPYAAYLRTAREACLYLVVSTRRSVICDPRRVFHLLGHWRLQPGCRRLAVVIEDGPQVC